MDLTDEQWAVLEPLLPEEERISARKRGRPWRNPRKALKASCGCCAPVRRGGACRSDIRHTRPAIVVSNAGCGLG